MIASAPSQPGFGSGSLINSLPETLRSYVESLGGDHDLNTVLVYGAISQAAGKGYSFRLRPGSPVTYPSLYLIPCAPPAHGKSWGVEQIFAPNFRLEKENAELQRGKQLRYEAMIEAIRWQVGDLSKQGKEAKEDIRVRLSISTSLARRQQRINSLVQKARWTGRAIATDVTPASLRNELSYSPTRHVSLILADGRQLIEQLIRNSESGSSASLLPILINGYSGDSIRVVRATGRAKDIEIANPRLSVLAAVQPDLGTRLFKSETYEKSGLASRFLVFFLDSLDSARKEGSPALSHHWDKQISLVRSGAMPKGAPLQFEMSSDARGLLRKCIGELEQFSSGSAAGPLRAAFLSRAIEQLQRLCLVRALMEYQGEEKPVITEEMVAGAMIFLGHGWHHLEKGIALASQPSIPHEVVERLRQAIKAAGGELPVDPKRRDSDRYGLSKKQVMKVVLHYPEEFQLARKPRNGKRGRSLIVVKRSV